MVIKKILTTFVLLLIASPAYALEEPGFFCRYDGLPGVIECPFTVQCDWSASAQGADPETRDCVFHDPTESPAPEESPIAEGTFDAGFVEAGWVCRYNGGATIIECAFRTKCNEAAATQGIDPSTGICNFYDATADEALVDEDGDGVPDSPSGGAGVTVIPDPINAGGDIRIIIGRVVKAILSIVGSVALAMFVYGGLVWVTSLGNTERVKTGRDVLIWASIGLIAIVTSYTIVDFIVRAIPK